MYLLYLDDAGSPGNQAEDYFVLGGICVYEAQVEWFGRELDKLASPHRGCKTVCVSAVLKERKHRRTEWQSEKN